MTPPRKGSKEIGKRLRAIRVSAGLNMTELAYHAGLSARTIENLEGGVTPVTDSALVKLARGLDKSVDWLDAKLNGNRRRTA